MSAWGKSWGKSWGSAWGRLRDPIDPERPGDQSRPQPGSPGGHMTLSQFLKRGKKPVAAAVDNTIAMLAVRKRQTTEDELLTLGIL
jgi:hypothetical protein